MLLYVYFVCITYSPDLRALLVGSSLLSERLVDPPRPRICSWRREGTLTGESGTWDGDGAGEYGCTVSDRHGEPAPRNG